MNELLLKGMHVLSSSCLLIILLQGQKEEKDPLRNHCRMSRKTQTNVIPLFPIIQPLKTEIRNLNYFINGPINLHNIPVSQVGDKNCN